MSEAVGPTAGKLSQTARTAGPIRSTTEFDLALGAAQAARSQPKGELNTVRVAQPRKQDKEQGRKPSPIIVSPGKPLRHPTPYFDGQGEKGRYTEKLNRGETPLDIYRRMREAISSSDKLTYAELLGQLAATAKLDPNPFGTRPAAKPDAARTLLPGEKITVLDKSRLVRLENQRKLLAEIKTLYGVAREQRKAELRQEIFEELQYASDPVAVPDVDSLIKALKTRAPNDELYGEALQQAGEDLKELLGKQGRTKDQIGTLLRLGEEGDFDQVRATARQHFIAVGKAEGRRGGSYIDMDNAMKVRALHYLAYAPLDPKSNDPYVRALGEAFMTAREDALVKEPVAEVLKVNAEKGPVQAVAKLREVSDIKSNAPDAIHNILENDRIIGFIGDDLQANNNNSISESHIASDMKSLMDLNAIAQTAVDVYIDSIGEDKSYTSLKESFLAKLSYDLYLHARMMDDKVISPVGANYGLPQPKFFIRDSIEKAAREGNVALGLALADRGLKEAKQHVVRGLRKFSQAYEDAYTEASEATMFVELPLTYLPEKVTKADRKWLRDNILQAQQKNIKAADDSRKKLAVKREKYGYIKDTTALYKHKSSDILKEAPKGDLWNLYPSGGDAYGLTQAEKAPRPWRQYRSLRTALLGLTEMLAECRGITKYPEYSTWWDADAVQKLSRMVGRQKAEINKLIYRNFVDSKSSGNPKAYGRNILLNVKQSQRDKLIAKHDAELTEFIENNRAKLPAITRIFAVANSALLLGTIDAGLRSNDWLDKINIPIHMSVVLLHDTPVVFGKKSLWAAAGGKAFTKLDPLIRHSALSPLVKQRLLRGAGIATASPALTLYTLTDTLSLFVAASQGEWVRAGGFATNVLSDALLLAALRQGLSPKVALRLGWAGGMAYIAGGVLLFMGARTKAAHRYDQINADALKVMGIKDNIAISLGKGSMNAKGSAYYNALPFLMRYFSEKGYSLKEMAVFINQKWSRMGKRVEVVVPAEGDADAVATLIKSNIEGVSMGITDLFITPDPKSETSLFDKDGRLYGLTEQELFEYKASYLEWLLRESDIAVPATTEKGKEMEIPSKIPKSLHFSNILINR